MALNPQIEINPIAYLFEGLYTKSIFLLLFFLYGITSDTKSQNREFIVGSMAGFYGIHIVGDIAEMYSQTSGELSGTGGFSVGFNVKRNFSKNVFGAFELRYIRKGSIYEFITSYGTVAYEVINLDYIEIPILIGFKINLKKKYLLSETGLAYARMISSDMLVSELNKWDVSPKLNSFKQNDFSWVANLKYPVIKSEKLLIGFRFSYSLMSIHSIYKLYNLDYGLEINYLFNRNVN